MIKQLKYVVFALLLMFTSTLKAQVTTSAVSGKVTSNGEPIIGATVIATHTPSGTTYGSVSNSDGRFNISGMRVGGPYSVKVSYVGYKTLSINNINLQLGETENISAILQEATTSLNEVVVQARRSPAKNSTITNITNNQITKLPSITRGITDFTKLSPFAGSSSSFAGRDGRYNTITLDGASLNNSFGLSSNNLPGGDAQPISLDAIEEISVNVSPYDVKYSDFTGASINVITKGGTNTLKGSAYMFLRPTSFTGNKVDTFKVANANTRSSKTYGFTLGGPIIKNKLFFFANGEIQKQLFPGVDWKASTNGVSDINSKTSRTTEADMQTISDFLKSKYNYDPGNYKDFGQFASDNWKFMARLDWNISQKHKFMVRLNAVQSKNDVQVNASSGPTGGSGDARIGISSMAFSNSNYKMKDIVTSITGELNSTFSSTLSNKLLATYTHIQDTRQQLGDPFPFVDIYNGGKQYMAFGTELFTPNNNVVNNVLSFIDNVSLTLNKHYITLGASFEKQYFLNSYLRYPYGYYRYASMADFMNNAKPTAYSLTYGYNGNDAPGADLNFGLGGVYAQDEWYINDGLRLTYGLRLDIPMYLDNMTANPAISALTFADNRKINVAQWPSTKVLLSPRLGFRWDVLNDRSIVVNGGSGVFTGQLPFVWFTNQPTNAGTIQNTVDLSGANLTANFFDTNYKNIIASHSALFPSTPSATAPGNIAFVDPNFKMPQVWRSSLGVDLALPYEFNLTLNGLYTRDIYNVVQINVNEKAPTLQLTGNDNRYYYATTNTTDRRINNNISTAMMLTNGKEKGYQYSFNATLTKKFVAGFSGFISYTYSAAKDLTANPGSSASSAWSSNVAVNSLNDPGLSNSNFSVPNRIISNISYELELFNHSKTTFSLFYSGYNTGRVSYTSSNDINRDGNSSDLMYIPATKDELTFADISVSGVVKYSKADQANDFWNYIQNNSYLKKHEGKYAERYGDLRPWLNRFDFKISQDFYTNIGKNKYGIQLSLDILNVGNMLNSKWGAYKTMGLLSYDNVRPIKLSSISATGAPIYQLNATDANNFAANNTWKYDVSTSSTWGMMFGVKVSF
jgi:hypothetical protein